MSPAEGGPNHGACLCGAVRFAFAPDRRDVTVCHCSQCRAWSGHAWASVNAPLATLTIEDREGALAWRRSSDYARRGFCRACGSALFWHADRLDEHKDRIAIAAGALASPTGVRLRLHIFAASKGDYYEIPDGEPQKATY
jgi:hypothetical protein